MIEVFGKALVTKYHLLSGIPNVLNKLIGVKV